MGICISTILYTTPSEVCPITTAGVDTNYINYIFRLLALARTPYECAPEDFLVSLKPMWTIVCLYYHQPSTFTFRICE